MFIILYLNKNKMTYSNNIKIKKRTGEIVDFSYNKLRNSLKHTGQTTLRLNKY